VARCSIAAVIGFTREPASAVRAAKATLQMPHTLVFPPWEDALADAETVYAGDRLDPTCGAVDYFDKSLDAHPPAWATDGSLVHACDLGGFHFYKLA
jgi:hypothetical protein